VKFFELKQNGVFYCRIAVALSPKNPYRIARPVHWHAEQGFEPISKRQYKAPGNRRRTETTNKNGLTLSDQPASLSN
jgi:hypothetical protein